MYINNKSIKHYKARLLGLQILPSSFQVDSFWGKDSLTPILNNDIKIKSKSLKLKVRFFGTNKEISINKSKFIDDISISILQFHKLDNEYNGYVTNIRLSDKTHHYETIEIEMEVLEEEQENIVEFSKHITLHLQNTGKTPCILELTPTQNLADVTITGLDDDITINNLTKGKKITIDGEKGTVLEEGKNKWPDYDSWSFPKLFPGENNITINKTSVNAKLKYKARWI